MIVAKGELGDGFVNRLNLAEDENMILALTDADFEILRNHRTLIYPPGTGASVVVMYAPDDAAAVAILREYTK